MGLSRINVSVEAALILTSQNQDLILWGATISAYDVRAEIAFIDAYIGDRIDLINYRTKQLEVTVKIPKHLQSLDSASPAFEIVLPLDRN